MSTCQSLLYLAYARTSCCHWASWWFHVAGLGWRVKNGGNEYSDGNVNPFASIVGRSVKAAGAGLPLGVGFAVAGACSVDCISLGRPLCAVCEVGFQRDLKVEPPRQVRLSPPRPRSRQLERARP